MSWQTRSTTRAARRCLLGALFSGALALPAAAQEHDEEWFPPELGPPPGVSEDEHDHQNEIVEIFHEVELSLRDIDDLLISAGAGEIPLEELQESGISRLLRGSQQKSEQVVAGIDRLLEVSNGSCPTGASWPNGSPSSSGGGQSQTSQSQGQSPLDQPQSQAPGDRENTPERPEGQQAEGEEPQDSQGGSQPESPLASDDPGQNNPNQPPEGSAAGAPATAEGDAGWGNLPPRAREVFTIKGGEDMPARYRDWIDAYYRRLSAID